MAKTKKTTAAPVEPPKLYRLVTINKGANLVAYMSRDPEPYDDALKRLRAAHVFPNQVLKLEEAGPVEPASVRRLNPTDTFIDPPDPTPPQSPTLALGTDTVGEDSPVSP